MSNRRKKSINQRDLGSPLATNTTETNEREHISGSTQQILQGVVAYIEVRSEADDRYRGVAKQIEMLGGKATKKFTADVTHVIYKDGTKGTREKAIKKGLPIVTVLWVEECKQSGERVSTDNFTIDLEKYKSPGYRQKRTRFMQPKSLEETAKDSAEKMKRRNRRLAKIKDRMTPEGPPSFTETWQDARTCSPFVVRPSLTPRIVPRTPGSALGRSIECDDTNSCKTSKQVLEDEDGDSLIQQIAKKLRFGENNGYIATPPRTSEDSTSTDEDDGVHDEKTSAVPNLKKIRKRKLLAMKQADSPNKDIPDPFYGFTRETTVSTEIKSSEETKENRKRKRGKSAKICESVSESDKNCQSKSKKNIVINSRTSLEDFTPGNVVTRKLKKTKESCDEEKQSKKRKKKTRCLVMTSVHSSDQEIVFSVVQKLGLFSVQNNVSSQTSHVIAGNERRTLNALKGIATGCWLLSLEWVMKSLEAGYWLEEEPYELNDFFPSAQLCRLERSTLGTGSYGCRLLTDVAAIYVANGTVPPTDEITTLILMSGGHICNSFRKASICIGQVPKATGAIQISEKWLLDCITSQSVLPFENYRKDVSSTTVRSSSPTF